MNRHWSVWLDCEHPGCMNGIRADSAHLANLTAPGGWDCGQHDTEDRRTP